MTTPSTLLAILVVATVVVSTLLAEPLEFAKAVCENTESGKYYAADSEGRVCLRNAVSSATGCCNDGEQFSCETCGDDACCGRYENCVSCCLSPDNAASEKYVTAFRIRGREESGRWPNAFQYCQGICRTWRLSTSHENDFISPRRYCFSEFGRPTTPELMPLPPLPEGVSVVPGESGECCNDACKRRAGVCVPDAFAAIRSCNALRAAFVCEAGCGELKTEQRREPYYIREDTSKRNLPGYCVVAANSDPTGPFDCDWKDAIVERLCPCLPAT